GRVSIRSSCCDLFARESHIAVSLFTGDFTSEPARGFESAAARMVRKLHFRHHQTMVAPVINVDLDLKIFPRNLIAGLAQPPPARRRPQQRELLWAQSDFTLFAG